MRQTDKNIEVPATEAEIYERIQRLPEDSDERVTGQNVLGFLEDREDGLADNRTQSEIMREVIARKYRDDMSQLNKRDMEMINVMLGADVDAYTKAKDVISVLRLVEIRQLPEAPKADKKEDYCEFLKSVFDGQQDAEEGTIPYLTEDVHEVVESNSHLKENDYLKVTDTAMMQFLLDIKGMANEKNDNVLFNLLSMYKRERLHLLESEARDLTDALTNSDLTTERKANLANYLLSRKQATDTAGEVSIKE